MKLRIVPKNQIKKAYEVKGEENKIDIKDEMNLDNIDKIPEELFLIISKTIKFIEKVNEEDEKWG